MASASPDHLDHLLDVMLDLSKLVFFVELGQKQEAVVVKLLELVAIKRPGRCEVGGVCVPRGGRDATMRTEANGQQGGTGDERAREAQSKRARERGGWGWLLEVPDFFCFALFCFLGKESVAQRYGRNCRGGTWCVPHSVGATGQMDP